MRLDGNMASSALLIEWAGAWPAGTPFRQVEIVMLAQDVVNMQLARVNATAWPTLEIWSG